MIVNKTNRLEVVIIVDKDHNVKVLHLVGYKHEVLGAIEVAKNMIITKEEK